MGPAALRVLVLVEKGLPMKLPKSLRILGRKFRIEYVDIIPENPLALGICQGTSRLIKISTMQHDSPAAILTTIKHEAIHAALHVAGYTEMMSTQHEEAVTMMLTHLFEELQEQLAKAGTK